ncbi:MAG: oligosaccharide flippase family protein [Methylotenera sp.]|nr:oligosaccharide flippase family protein [Methylotenera sp.]
MKRTVSVGLSMFLGQLMIFVATPILSRIYTPEQFGLFAIFMSVVALVTSVIGLRYESLIHIVKDQEVINVILLAFFSMLVMMLLVIMVIWLGIPQLFFPPINNLGKHIWAIPISVAAGFMLILVNFITLRKNNFTANFILRTLQPMFYIILAIFLYRGDLVLAQAFSLVVAAFCGVLYVSRDFGGFNLRSIVALAIRFKKYPTILTFTTLLDAAALSLPIFFISFTYGHEVTGNFSQLQRLAGAPILLASAALGQIFFKYSGEHFRAGETSKLLMWKIVKFLALTALILLILLIFIGEPLLALFLGENWRVDTVFLLLVTIPLYAKTVVSPITTIFLTHHRLNLVIKWQSYYFLSTLTVLYLTTKFLKLEIFLLIFCVHEIFWYSIYLYLANQIFAQSKSES